MVLRIDVAGFVDLIALFRVLLCWFDVVVLVMLLWFVAVGWFGVVICCASFVGCLVVRGLL